jgi:transposase
MKDKRYVGLDVHAETIAVAVAEEGRTGEVRFVGVIENRPEAVRRLVRTLRGKGELRMCYEAGPTGYVLSRQFSEMGVACDVVAPTLVPTRAGDRVKTDRRDAERLARSHRAGELTAVHIPAEEHEALRDLLRAREAAKADQLRARHRLLKFLLRHGKRPPEGMHSFTQRHEVWMRTVRMQNGASQATLEDYLAEAEHQRQRILRLERAIDEALQEGSSGSGELIASLQCLRGVATISAATLVAELGDLRRFKTPRQLMSYAGLVPREHSSGNKTRRGAITRTGNAHVRRIAVEAAWAYRHRPGTGPTLSKRQRGKRPELIGLATKAQHRLCMRYRKLTARGKSHSQAVTAVARELLGFVWAIGQLVPATDRISQAA